MELLEKCIDYWLKCHELLIEHKGKYVWKSEAKIYHKDFRFRHGIETCPLCQEHYEDRCEGCPLFRKKNYCQDTPYASYIEYQTKIINNKLIKLHQNMIDHMRKIYKGEISEKK